jgi:hypothetical protein
MSAVAEPIQHILHAMRTGRKSFPGFWLAASLRPCWDRSLSSSQAAIVLQFVKVPPLGPAPHTSAPLAMVGCGHSVTDAALGIQWHVLAMYAPSFVTGAMIARFGIERITGIGLA